MSYVPLSLEEIDGKLLKNVSRLSRFSTSDELIWTSHFMAFTLALGLQKRAET